MANLQLIRETLNRYEEVTSKIREVYPRATQDQIHTMAAVAMNKSLGLYHLIVDTTAINVHT
jgi:hypothetical protein